MAKKRAGKSRDNDSASGLSRFFHAVTSTPWRQLILLAVMIVLLTWQWPAIEAAAGGLAALFGWGLIILIAGAITVLVMVRQGKAASFVLRWNWWLGGISFLMAVWGVLGFLRMGGAFGQAIIGAPQSAWGNVLGALRIWLLMFLGVILIFPAACWLLAGRAVRGITRRMKQRRLMHVPPATGSHLPLQPAKSSRPPRAARVTPAATEDEAPDGTPSPAEMETGAAPEAAKPERAGLKQVAADVWKKYGQSGKLITIDGWKLPPLDILDTTPEVEFSEADNMRRAKQIEDSLSSYGVEAKVVQINTGPTVTQFGVEPGWDRKTKELKEKDKDGNVKVSTVETGKTRVKVERITSLANDLALALSAPSIRIEAPVPGKPIVGVEVPNTVSGVVSMRGVIESNPFQKLVAKTKMAVALGKGAGGEAVSSDLTKMPHLLVAGATGSGKTVCLNAIICCLLMHNTPYDVRFIMVDPKRVELTQYNSIPHLATPVIVEASKALTALRWLGMEMDERYQKLAKAGARHIEGYNKGKTGAEKLPYLVLIIDELADLMMAGFDEVETTLCRLAQLARATGIHLIVATQRPSVDVVTGLIKANFPTRISFAVTSQVDSRTILDSGGAEKLLGKGDMLFMPTEAAKPKRLQGCFLSDAEIDRLVYFWGGQRQEENTQQLKMDSLATAATATTTDGYPKDPLLEQALAMANEHEHISTSFLQRRLHIGYPRAARLMEQLEEELRRTGAGEDLPADDDTDAPDDTPPVGYIH
ncbi:MAG: DNA translocase FtsK [Dehalococcoidales bacterium]|nr:DNA translocase FtsK [Dehalococcoidales bacterium]